MINLRVIQQLLIGIILLNLCSKMSPHFRSQSDIVVTEDSGIVHQFLQVSQLPFCAVFFFRSKKDEGTYLDKLLHQCRNESGKEAAVFSKI